MLIMLLIMLSEFLLGDMFFQVFSAAFISEHLTYFTYIIQARWLLTSIHSFADQRIQMIESVG